MTNNHALDITWNLGKSYIFRGCVCSEWNESSLSHLFERKTSYSFWDEWFHSSDI